jgi:spermidine/putrescine transport system substrate-binding protein
MHSRHLLNGLLLCLTCSTAWGGTPEIVLFNWSDYLPQEVLERFTRETGISVRTTTYDSNEAMYAKLKLLNGGGYDVAFPSSYFVDKMRKEGMLRRIDKGKLPHFNNLDPRQLDQPFDPGNLYSVPYLWGTTGIMVNTAKFKPSELVAWADLWKPEFRNRLLLPNDMREAFHVALRVLGFSGNTTDREQIRQAYEMLKKLLPNIRIFSSDAIDVLFVTGEVDAGVAWNGIAYKARHEDSHLRYIHPREGVILWMDNLVILKNAPHAELAHQLIDFILRPGIAQLITEKIGYTSPNAEAIKRLDPQLRSDPTAYPDDTIVSKGEYQTDIGPAIAIYSEYWEKLKAE